MPSLGSVQELRELEPRGALLLKDARGRETSGCMTEAIARYESVITAAERSGEEAVLVEALRRVAVVRHHQGDHMRARVDCRRSYGLARALGNDLLAAEALNTLGGLDLTTGFLEDARRAFVRALELGGADRALRARVEQNLGIVSNIRGDLDLAETHYRRSLVAYEALPDPHGSAIAHHNLGMLAGDRGDFAKASDHFTICEKLAEDSRDLHLVALCLLNHAEVLVALNRPTVARQNAEAAERMFQGLGMHFDAGDVQRVLALCDRAEGQVRQAEARLDQARELARQTGARLTEAEVLRELGRLYRETGRAAEGAALLREAARAFAGLGARGEAGATESEAALLR